MSSNIFRISQLDKNKDIVIWRNPPRRGCIFYFPPQKNLKQNINLVFLNKRKF